MKKIGVLTLKTSNYQSICRALISIGCEIVLLENTGDFEKISHLIIPGVSKFESIIAELEQSNYISSLEKAKAQGKFILGLCAGMQIMGKSSEESLGIKGLNWFDFKVESVVPDISKGVRRFHTGWDTVDFMPQVGMFDVSGCYYFNHSFYVKSASRISEIGTTDYGVTFSSVIKLDNVLGAQFHPEKSQLDGLKFLSNFAKLPL
jgi:glutamine amidotransferase